MIMDSDELVHKIKKLEKSFGSMNHDVDTAGALVFIQQNKNSIKSNMYNESRYKKHDESMRMILEVFPKADKFIISKKLRRLGFATKKSDLFRNATIIILINMLIDYLILYHTSIPNGAAIGMGFFISILSGCIFMLFKVGIDYD